MMAFELGLPADRMGGQHARHHGRLDAAGVEAARGPVAGDRHVHHRRVERRDAIGRAFRAATACSGSEPRSLIEMCCSCKVRRRRCLCRSAATSRSNGVRAAVHARIGRRPDRPQTAAQQRLEVLADLRSPVRDRGVRSSAQHAAEIGDRAGRAGRLRRRSCSAGARARTPACASCRPRCRTQPRTPRQLPSRDASPAASRILIQPHLRRLGRRPCRVLLDTSSRQFGRSRTSPVPGRAPASRSMPGGEHDRHRNRVALGRRSPRPARVSERSSPAPAVSVARASSRTRSSGWLRRASPSPGAVKFSRVTTRRARRGHAGARRRVQEVELAGQFVQELELHAAALQQHPVERREHRVAHARAHAPEHRAAIGEEHAQGAAQGLPGRERRAACGRRRDRRRRDRRCR